MQVVTWHCAQNLAIAVLPMISKWKCWISKFRVFSSDVKRSHIILTEFFNIESCTTRWRCNVSGCTSMCSCLGKSLMINWQLFLGFCEYISQTRPSTLVTINLRSVVFVKVHIVIYPNVRRTAVALVSQNQYVTFSSSIIFFLNTDL